MKNNMKVSQKTRNRTTMHAYSVTCQVLLFVTLWTVASQASQSMGCSRQEYWSELSCLPPGDLPNPGTEPGLSHCRQMLYRLSHQGSPWQRGRLKTILSGSRWVGTGLEHPKSKGCMSHLQQGFRARHTSQLPVGEERQPHTWFLIIGSVRNLYNSC